MSQIIQLRRENNLFVSRPEVQDDSDFFDEGWYRHYINKHCRKERHQVDLDGNIDDRTIFVSNDDNNVAFVVRERDEEISKFDLPPPSLSLIDTHVRKFSHSETFFESYRLSVSSQVLPSPLYKLQKSPDGTSSHRLRVSTDEMLNTRYSIIFGAPRQRENDIDTAARATAS